MIATDVFDLSKQYNLLMIFDCPSSDSNAYQKFSDEIVQSSHEAVIIFFDTEIPSHFSKAAQQNIQLKVVSQVP